MLKAAALSLALVCGVVVADEKNSDTTTVHAVMFEWAFDKDGNIRHAQVIAGYASLEDCRNAMRTVMGRATVVEEGLTPQLVCQAVMVPVEKPKNDGSVTL